MVTSFNSSCVNAGDFYWCGTILIFFCREMIINGLVDSVFG